MLYSERTSCSSLTEMFLQWIGKFGVDIKSGSGNSNLGTTESTFLSNTNFILTDSKILCSLHTEHPEKMHAQFK